MCRERGKGQEKETGNLVQSAKGKNGEGKYVVGAKASRDIQDKKP
jgi:hypothetical protein